MTKNKGGRPRIYPPKPREIRKGLDPAARARFWANLNAIAGIEPDPTPSRNIIQTS